MLRLKGCRETTWSNPSRHRCPTAVNVGGLDLEAKVYSLPARVPSTPKTPASVANPPKKSVILVLTLGRGSENLSLAGRVGLTLLGG